MKRILFVDDEPRILEGLQRLLRPQRQQWDMVFACGGPAALEQLERSGFDVIVTDMRMPRIDGADLLRHVAAHHPETVRIVLSGHSDMESILRVVDVAHQFLSKPCQPELLRDAVERAGELQGLLASPSLRGLVGGLGALPSRPAEYESLLRLLDDPDVALRDLARIVQQDIAMCAKCLQLVNSAFFGLSQRVTNIERAISYLGLRTLKSMVLSTAAFSSFKVDPGLAQLCYERLPARAMNTATLAARLVHVRTLADDAFMAGMLHDVGILILAAGVPGRYREILDQARHSRRPVFEVEREVLGCSHAEVGAYLLGAWGLPLRVVEAVARHHTPRPPVDRQVDLVGAAHIADALIEDADGAGEDAAIGPGLDLDYLDQIGATAQLPAWRAMATELARNGDAA